MSSDSGSFTKHMRKASTYGLQEFLEIMGELAQESTKKGALSRLQKEMITLGLALHKNCHRCIDIHSADAARLGASDKQMGLVKKVALFMRASPHGNSNLWPDWVGNWQDYSYSRNIEKHRVREMIALAIAIVMQHQEQIALHLQAVLKSGVSVEEVFEIMPLVMLMDGAPTLSQIPVIVQGCEAFAEPA